MYSMNQLTIIGFTGQDAETHYTSNGTLVTTLSVATKESWKDGNGDGVRTADITQQVDRVVEPPIVLSDLFPGTSIGVAPGMPVTEAVALSGTNILSLSPNGTATSGSIYIVGRDHTQWAVRVLGVTARTRVMRFDRAAEAWVNAD